MTNQVFVFFDSFHTDATVGYEFAADETLTIAAGILVGSAQGTGVDSTTNNDTLLNNGDILSGSHIGVYFSGGNGAIFNNAGHSIIGKYSGIRVGWDFEAITNHGTVMGLDYAGVAIDFNSNHVTLDNDGEIFGRTVGVEVNSSGGGTINNAGSGLIRSDHVGIYVQTAPLQTTFITNGLHATIRGGDHSISVADGAISLTNLGTLFGDVLCASPNANDTIVNNGTINGSVYLGSGSEVYNGKGGGIVTGAVYGGGGDNRFIAGPAKETFFGGAGADSFVFDSIRFSPPTAKRDTINNFNPANGDRIDVHGIDADVTHAGHQHFVFIGTQTFAHYHSLHPGVVGMLRFDPASHQLQGNVNANFSNAEFEVTLPGVTAFHAGDLILA